MSRMGRALRVAAVLVSIGAPAKAADPPVKAVDPNAKTGEPPAEDWTTDRPALRYDLPVDAGVTATAGVTWLTLTLLEPALTPKHCRWCDRNSDGSDGLNGFDRSVRSALKWKNTSLAGTASTIFSFGLAPLAGLGIGALITKRDGRVDELPVDLLVVAESAFVALDLNEISKFSFARQRPDAHYRNPASKTPASADDNVSFFSGHTTLAFALATSAGTVGSLRHYRLAAVMWAVGLVFATTGGYLRIAADRHYATDVITGALVGAGAGFGVPYLFHRPIANNVRLALMPTDGGVGLSVFGFW